MAGGVDCGPEVALRQLARGRDTCTTVAAHRSRRRHERLFHLARESCLDQCLRPSREEHGLGFGKVGLGPTFAN